MKYLIFIGLLLIQNQLLAKTTIAISSTPSNLNPLFSTDANSQNINRLLYRSLIDYDRKMNPICDACESFEEKILNDGKQKLFFKIKKDLKFHNGDPIDSFAIKKIIEKFKDDEYESVFLSSFKKIIDIKTYNSDTLEITFDSFDYDNMGNLALVRFFKLKPGYTKQFNFNHFIGSGNYWYKENNNQKIVIERLSGKGLKEIEFKVVKDETTNALKIINKEVDISLSNMSARKFSWLEKNGGEGIKVVSSPGSNYVYLNMNHENELLKKRNVRVALAHLVPRDKIIKYRFKGLAKKATSLFSSAFKGYQYDGSGYVFSPEKAKLIIEKLGAKLKDGYYEINGKRLSFELIISTNKSSLEIAKILKDEFSKSGVHIEVSSMEWGTFMRRYKGGQFDLVLAQWVGFTGPGIMNYIFHSKNFPPAGGNRGRYVNKGFEELYEKSLFAKNQSERVEMINEAIRLVFDDVAYISLWHPSVSWVVGECIKNVKPYSNGSFLALNEVENVCQK